MKIIDEKGRLFGLINVIDLIIIIVLVMLIGGGAKRMKNPEIEVEDKEKGEEKVATITLEIDKVREHIVDGVVVGDDLYHDKKGGKFGEIIDKKVENQQERVKGSDGQYKYQDVPDRYKVTLIIEAKAEDTPREIIIGDKAARVGSKLDFKNKKVKFTGTIIDLVLE